MKVKNFWHLKQFKLGEFNVEIWHIVDGNGDIVLQLDYEYIALYQEICNLHNLTHLEEQE